MSTRNGGVSGEHFGLNMSYNVGDEPDRVAENRKLFLREMDIEESLVAFPLQEHTATVMDCSLPNKYPHCDGLVTNRSSLYLAVTVADCTPVVLYDTKNNVIAGVHAGWRGTAAKIAVNALKTMSHRYSTIPSDVVAFIGPSAGGCCYEVGEEVAKSFPKECITPLKNKKYLLDVKKTNLLQLLENGLQESHIEVHSDCTIHNKEYHSYRRDGAQSGRMLAIIGLKQ